MKKILSLIFIFNLLYIFVSCDAGSGDSTGSSEMTNESITESGSSEKQISSETQSSAMSENSSVTTSSINSEVNVDYEDVITNLGWLLGNGYKWSTTDEIQTSDVIMWYATFLEMQHSDDEFYLSQYLIDGKDGFYLPAPELEVAAMTYFNISPEKLQKDELYNSKNGTYTTSSPTGPRPDRDIKVNKAQIVGDNVIIDFSIINLSINSTTDHQLVISNNDVPVYISYK